MPLWFNLVINCALIGHIITHIPIHKPILTREYAKFGIIPKVPKQEGYVQMHISAIGFRAVNVENDIGQIVYVDPASDLYGKVDIGDLIISIAGYPWLQSVHMLVNFGNAGTYVDVLIIHKGIAIHHHCRRVPLEKFEPTFARSIATYLRP